jgi:alkanesulfonate monooxygenase SsuD/methylene tetrahydromethanopterin reductase-like flavin-dependent oxidoreductase (luciferase family)
VLRHYQIEQEGFGNAKGYEYYKKMGDAMRRDGGDSAAEFFASLQAYGTPEQVLGTIRNIQSQIGNDSTVHVFSYDGMPYDDAERSMRLFAEKVQPELSRSASS